ncbi:hypothetical protein QZH41_001921 [Actinostola sp. cb2023]|nr:hypothetical protein QZH41_001921 [Actinostola sp. cb2023]
MNSTNFTRISRGWMEFRNRGTVTVAMETSTLLLIGLIAISGNLLVVISVYRNPSLRTITNYFVLSLALESILYPTMSLPLTLVTSIKRRYVSGQSACDFQATVIVSLVYLTVISIALMAVNRYVRVCKPQKYARIFNKKSACFMLGFAWIVTFAVVTFVLKGTNMTKAMFSPRKMACLFFYRERFSLPAILGNLCFALCLFTPLITIIFCYYKVFKKIREHKRNIAPSSTNSGLGTSIQEVKITWTLFAVLLSYLLSWIPAFVIIMVGNIFGLSALPRQVHMLVTYTVLASSAVNPLIYGTLSPQFRNEYAKIFKIK